MKEDKTINYLTLSIGFISILVSGILYVASLDKRVALLEQSHAQAAQRFDKLEEKVDKIYSIVSKTDN